MLKRLILAGVLLAAMVVPVDSQVAVPNTLVAGTTIAASALNTNFTTIANHALDRLAGGTLSGNVAVDPGITIDGVDIGVQSCVACTPTFAKITTSNTSVTSATFGGGITAGTGVVGIVDTTGKIPAISSTYFASLSGANLTNLTPSNLVYGLSSKVGTYTAVTTDQIILANGTFTVTMYTCTGNSGKWIEVKNTGVGTVTLAGNAAELIDGTNTFPIVTQYQALTLVCDGTSWNII